MMNKALKILEDDTLKEITPEVIAELFCSMCSDEQAAFFNHVDAVGSPWMPFQLQAITDEDGLTLQGRRVMQQIGEYSHWGLVPHLSVRA
jgi:hypothetical protein